MRNARSIRGTRVSTTRYAVAGLVVASSFGAMAEESTPLGVQKLAMTVTPRVSVAETFTDNVGLSSTNRKSEQTTEVSPGVRINIDGARLKSYFDYSLSEILYAQNSSPTQTQHALNTFGRYEAIDNRAFVEFSGVISQQNVSAFGTQSVGNSSVNANRTEVSSYSLTPYLRGPVGTFATYDARYSRSVTSASGAAGLGVTSVNGAIKLVGNRTLGKFGWSADASRQSVAYSEGRDTESDLVSVGLSYLITPQLSVSASTGREANNYSSLNKESSGTNGFGINWSPSELTRFTASRNQHVYGDTYSVSFTHRTPRTIWTLTDSRDAVATPNQFGVASLGSVYDILTSLLGSRQAADAFLLANPSVNANANISTGFLTSAVSMQRRQDISFALLGVRDTITFTATRGENSRLDSVTTATDDLSSATTVRQRGFIVNYSHRLTPDYSMGVLVSQQNQSGSVGSQETRLRFVNLSVTGRLGKRSTANVGIHRVVSDGNVASYDENVINGNLTVQF